ncbi:hypothetical protein K8T06_00960, partial [bacterium]|nr:hypothetical protein [bacterium]
LNLGIRYEWMEFQEDSGNTDVPAWSWGNFRADSWLNSDGSPKEIAPMRFDDMLAPRLRISWDVFGNESTIVNGFFGRYYNPFDLSLPMMFQTFSADNYAAKRQDYIGPEWHDMNKDGVPDEDHFFDDSNWGGTNGTEAFFTNLIDPDLKAEYTDEFVVGIQQKILDNLTISLNYIHRKTNDLIEDVGLFVDDDGNIVWTYLGAVNDDFTGLKPGWNFDPRDDQRDYKDHIYYITNAEENTRDYNGLELSVLAKNNNWDFQIHYTLSKTEGSTTEGFQGIYQFTGQYDTVQTSQNLFGELPWSSQHNLRIAGAYWFNITDWYEMSFGVNALYTSGYRYSQRWRPANTYDPDYPGDDINDPDTWSGQPPYRNYSWCYPNGRGNHELPSFYTIDVSWQNTFKFGHFGAATVIFDINNVTDHQAIIAESEEYNPRKPDYFGQATNWSGPRNYRLSLKYAF